MKNWIKMSESCKMLIMATKLVFVLMVSTGKSRNNVAVNWRRWNGENNYFEACCSAGETNLLKFQSRCIRKNHGEVFRAWFSARDSARRSLPTHTQMQLLQIFTTKRLKSFCQQIRNLFANITTSSQWKVRYHYHVMKACFCF